MPDDAAYTATFNTDGMNALYDDPRVTVLGADAIEGTDRHRIVFRIHGGTPPEYGGDLTLDDLPDPAAEAADRADHAREAGLGVARDELTDTAIAAESARVEMEKLYVTLDSLCDNGGAFPAAIQSYLRFVQHRSTLYQEWFAEYEAALRTERDAVIRDAHDDPVGSDADE